MKTITKERIGNLIKEIREEIKDIKELKKDRIKVGDWEALINCDITLYHKQEFIKQLKRL